MVIWCFLKNQTGVWADRALDHVTLLLIDDLGYCGRTITGACRHSVEMEKRHFNYDNIET